MTELDRSLLIGEFARDCRLPVSTLRYYDKIGLLRPRLVDPATSYRRYGADQLPTAVLVARLRAIGTAPDDIATVLSGGPAAAAVLAAERRRITEEVATARRALAELDELLLPPSRHTVTLVDLRAERVAVAPFRAPHGDLAAAVLRSIAGLRGVLRRAGCGRVGTWGAMLPLEIAEEVDGAVFARTAQPVGHLGLRTAPLPATSAARTVHHGSPATVARAYQAVLDVIRREGRTAAGPVIEEYPGLDEPGGPSVLLTVPIAAPEPAG